MPGVSRAFGGFMQHDWVFDVLEDLKSYALANGLPALAAKAEEALQIAAVEVAAQSTGGDTPADQRGFRQT